MTKRYIQHDESNRRGSIINVESNYSKEEIQRAMFAAYPELNRRINNRSLTIRYSAPKAWAKFRSQTRSIFEQD